MLQGCWAEYVDQWEAGILADWPIRGPGADTTRGSGGWTGTICEKNILYLRPILLWDARSAVWQQRGCGMLRSGPQTESLTVNLVFCCYTFYITNDPGLIADLLQSPWPFSGFVQRLSNCCLIARKWIITRYCVRNLVTTRAKGNITTRFTINLRCPKYRS